MGRNTGIRRKRGIKRNKKLRAGRKWALVGQWVLALAFSAIFVCSIINIILYHKALEDNKEELEEVIREAVLISPMTDQANVEADGEKGKSKEGAGPGIDFHKLREINSDIAGWIIFHNGHVNNPLVQTDDNSYYLKHSFKKQRNSAGCIFMDYRNQSLDDRNVVIYGHNNVDGTMFGSLKDVFEEGFFDQESNHWIYLYDTESNLRKYRIFSYYVADREECYTSLSFQDKDAYNRFLETIKKRSMRNFNVTVTADDKIITLSTCHGMSGTKKRKVIHAKLIK